MTPVLWAALAWGAERGVEHAEIAPSGLDAVFAERRVALVVGVDTYVDPAVPGLAYAAADARAIADVLADPDLAGFDQVRVLEGRVDRDTFWAAFDEVTAPLDRLDTFVLYFAGHGSLTWAGATDTALFLLTSDTALDTVRETGLALAELEARLEGLGTERRVVVLDTCYSGLGRSTWSTDTEASMRGLRGTPPVAEPVTLRGRYEARLYAAAHHEPAREDEALGNGVYTHYLVSGLRSGEADLDRDGRVELLEAHWWAQQHTVSHTEAAQHPWMEVTQVGEEWLFLTGGEADAPEAAILVVPDPQVTARGLQAPAEVQVDGERRSSGALAPGLHHVVVFQGGETQLDVQVEVRPGDRVDIGVWLDRHRGTARAAPARVGELQGGPEVRLGLEGGRTAPPLLSSAPSAGAWLTVAGRTRRPHVAWTTGLSLDLGQEVLPTGGVDVASRMALGTTTVSGELGDRWAVGLGPTAGLLWRLLALPDSDAPARDQVTWAVGATVHGLAPVVGPVRARASAALLTHPLDGAMFGFPALTVGLGAAL